MFQNRIELESMNRYLLPGMTTFQPADIAHPDMRKIMKLYIQSRYAADSDLEHQAEELLEKLCTDVSSTMHVCLENGLLGIGCGLIYLLRNGFVEGDEDVVLSEIDQALFYALIELEDRTTVDWYGWLYYSRLRISYDCLPERGDYTNVFQERAIYMLDRLIVGIGEGLNWNEYLLSEIEAFHQMAICPKITSKLLSLLTSIENERVTFIIPLRVDSKERERNLDIVIEMLVKIKNADILILEGDQHSCYSLKKEYPQVKYHFVSDFDPIFHRTKYLNWLFKQAEGSVVGVWDTDVVMPEEQINEAIQLIRNGKAMMSFPYDGRFYLLSPDKSHLFEKERFYTNLYREMKDIPLGLGAHSVGGAFLVNRKVYLQAGGENEHFYGWGQEDAERVKRMEILDLPVSRVQGPLFHLYHPRNENSWYADKETERRNRREFLFVCSMTHQKLQAYIESWEEQGCLEQQNEHFNIERKQKKEADFWKSEIEQYRLWYNGELPYLYNTPAPLPQEKIICDNPVHSYILTWTELHQKPKYLHELRVGSRQFVGKKVLDVGAGPIPSAICFEGCELYALDPLMSVYRKLGFPHELYPNVHFVEASAERIPFEDNFFDVILSVNAIDHVDHLEQVAKELQRVAKPDGLFLMHVEYHKTTICEPVEMNDVLIQNLFAWVRNMRIMSRSTCSFSSVVDGHGQYVLWDNL